MPHSRDILSVSGNFDGGNPKNQAHIRRGEEPGEFVVTPTWEKPPTQECGLAFAVMVRNAGPKAAPITIRIDWSTPMHMQYKDVYYLNRDGEDDWRELKAAVEGQVATVSFIAEPGDMYLSLTPMYTYADSLAFADAMSERADIEAVLAGKSRAGREIWRLWAPAEVEAAAEPVFFLARNNACETSGNFMIEGMIRFLVSGDPAAERLMERFVFHFLPMSNPDGAHDGLERDTSARGGAWLARVITAADPAHDVIRRALERVRPAVFVNLHNWMMRDVDGLLCNDELYARRLAELLPAAGTVPHRRVREWYSETATEVEEIGDATIYPLAKMADLHESSGGTWKDFCRERFGSRAMAVEFPWQGRTVEDMRALGVALLRAVCAIRIEEREGKQA